MITACRECGASLADGQACIDRFHALLLMEYEVAADPTESSEGRGAVTHFYAVSSYVLQHPNGMNYTAEALTELRRDLADHLAGRVTLPELRHRVSRAAVGPGRVTCRAGDEVVWWSVQSWPVTVADIIKGGVIGYGKRVAAWAESVVGTLEAATGRSK